MVRPLKKPFKNHNFLNGQMVFKWCDHLKTIEGGALMVALKGISRRYMICVTCLHIENAFPYWKNEHVLRL